LNDFDADAAQGLWITVQLHMGCAFQHENNNQGRRYFFQ
jgi:hypothetical protein